MADEIGAPVERISAFKVLAVEAAARVAGGRAGLRHADRRHLRPRGAVPRRRPPLLDRPPGGAAGLPPAGVRGRRPTSAASLVEWPVGHTIKCLCFYHPDDPPELKAAAGARAAAALRRRAPHRPRAAGRDHRRQARAAGGRHGGRRSSQRLYELGIKPDWWKLEPQTRRGGLARRSGAAIDAQRSAYCRGIVLLGLEAPEDELEAAFAVAARSRTVKGFAVGRTIFNDAAAAWLKGEIIGRGGHQSHGREIRPAGRGLAACGRPGQGSLRPGTDFTLGNQRRETWS